MQGGPVQHRVYNVYVDIVGDHMFITEGTVKGLGQNSCTGLDEIVQECEVCCILVLRVCSHLLSDTQLKTFRLSEIICTYNLSVVGSCQQCKPSWAKPSVQGSGGGAAQGHMGVILSCRLADSV